MSGAKTVHQCLFCPQTFDSAAEKDDHILEHFAQELCVDCNRNLIRIGGKLYTLHDPNTCIKTNLKLEPPTFTEDILSQDDLTDATTLPNTDLDEQMIIKVEPTIEHFADKTNDVEFGAVQIKEECIFDANTEMRETIFTEQLQTDLTTYQSYTEPMTQNIDRFNVNSSDLPTCSKTTKPHQSSHSSKSKRKTAKSDGPSLNELTCDICFMSFSHRYNVKRHKISFHSPPGTIFCKLCLKFFETDEARDQHRIECYEKKKNRLENPKIHIGKTFECYLCRKTADSRRKISDHMRYVHVKMKNRSRRTFVCTWCGKLFDREYLFKEHENIHTREIKHRCSYEGCGKDFTARSSLYAHMRHVHEGHKRYQCRIDGCDQSFGGIIGFNKHKCDVHGIPFVENSKRKAKSRLPMSIKYQCPYEECRKIFVHHSSRYKHVKEVHEGLKKYKCKIDGCEYTFGGKVGLRNHKRDMHGVSDDLLY